MESGQIKKIRAIRVVEQTEDVYDITTTINHNFFANNTLVHNCGEIVLSPNDSCRLISENLLSFVIDPFTPQARFDYDRFEKSTILAQRLMDDMIDLELEKLDQIISKIESDPESDKVKREEKELWYSIRNACLQGRRTGLGITALGDTLAALGIVYGSPESIVMTENIYRALAKGAHKSSLIMAEERGSFPVFDYGLEKNHEYLSKIICDLGPEWVLKWRNTGRRNIALTTTAPTGTVSLMTQTTSGIEPCFMPVYKRRRKILAGSDDRVDHVDGSGDRWHEYEVCHHQFARWRKVTGKHDIEESPYFKATANDVDWLASVEIQAAAQRWIDHSISKTCNLPNSATEELVSEIYIKAWETGCKGFTVYRDGCRDGVLVSTDTKKEETPKFEEKNAPKRPDILDCDIHQVKIKGEAWTIFIGKYEDKPYEIFGGLSKYVLISKKHTFGKLIKNPKKKNTNKSTYDVSIGDDVMTIKDIANAFENPTEGEFTRMISLALRHGAPVQYIVEQLQKDEESDMYSFSKVMSRVLKTYIKDGIKSKETCPNCGAALAYIEGCKQCSESCGYSKCG